MTLARTARQTLEGQEAPPAELLAEVARQSDGAVDPSVERLVRPLRERFGEALAGVLLYGSCLRSGALSDGLVDLYAVVDDYEGAYPGGFLRLGNAVLPPNVFYMEDRSSTPTLRAKYAVVSMADLHRGCGSWFHPYLWARFAQPARVVAARDDRARRELHEALATAVVRFHREAVPLLPPGRHDAEAVWQAGLARSYAAELRAEKGRAGTLVAAQVEALVRLTVRAAPAVPGLHPRDGGQVEVSIDDGARRRARRRWRARRWQGRVLSVLRLVKAAFTFENGVDYLAWKIERHTGEHIDVTPGLRRRPVLGGLAMLVRLLKRGVVR